MLNPDQTLAFAKTQLAALATLGQHWLDCCEQLATLQLSAGKGVLKDCVQLSHELMATSSPEQLWSACSMASAPALEKADAYGRRLHEILGQAGTGWSQFGNTHVAEARQLFSALLEQAGHNLPQVPDMGTALFQHWIASASASLESMQKAGRQLAEVADANWKTLSSPARQVQ
jgi:phasin family protein